MAVATECHSRSGFGFQRKLVVDFEGGEITGDAGLVVLREFDERLALTSALGKLVADGRDRRYVSHSVLDLVRQRIYQIAAGYEDANDATFLRDDPTMRAVVDRVDRPLGLAANTLASGECRRLGLRAASRRRRAGVVLPRGRRDRWAAAQFPRGAHPRHRFERGSDPRATRAHLLQRALRLLHVPPDLHLRGRVGDAPGVAPAAGQRRGRSVSCSHSCGRGSTTSGAIPKRSIAIRADGDFAKPELLDYAEYAGCSYTIGMPRNPKLEGLVERLRQKAEAQWRQSGKPVCFYTSLSYQTRSWSRARRDHRQDRIHRTGEEPSLRGHQPRGRAESIFDWYEQRGQAENFIKDLKNEVAADRLSCSAYRANAFRLELHAFAYDLLDLFRRLTLRGTALATATLGTIRLRLLKVGARVRPLGAAPVVSSRDWMAGTTASPRHPRSRPPICARPADPRRPLRRSIIGGDHAPRRTPSSDRRFWVTLSLHHSRIRTADRRPATSLQLTLLGAPVPSSTDAFVNNPG